ncbi:MAG: hypothetical protein ABI673_07130 [Novosphingobium sp.]
MTIAEIKKNVNFLNWVAGGAAGAIIALYFTLSSQISGVSRDVTDKSAHLSDQIADLRVGIEGQRGDVRSVLEKLNEHSEASPPKR